MRRAALLTTHGDPFVTSYWLRNFDRVWGGAVDELYVHLSGHPRGEPTEWLRAELERRAVEVIHKPERMVHGVAIGELVSRCDADLVMLIEDDAYVRDPTAVAEAFNAIERRAVDVIATPRGGMSPAVEAAAVARWGRSEFRDGGSGPGLWPCFFFARNADLKSTSMTFHSHTWAPGDTIPGLEYRVVDEPVTTDTMTTIAFELRANSRKIGHCVQHKELWHKALPVHGAPWFHAGGLSNGDFLVDGPDGMGELSGEVRPYLGGSNEGNDWAHRIWWWRRCLAAGPDTLPKIPYARRLQSLATFLGVDEEVARWNEVLPQWISWDDRATVHELIGEEIE